MEHVTVTVIKQSFNFFKNIYNKLIYSKIPWYICKKKNQ